MSQDKVKTIIGFKNRDALAVPGKVDGVYADSKSELRQLELPISEHMTVRYINLREVTYVVEVPDDGEE